MVVQSESIEFIVILQNPFIFDLELESLSLRLGQFQHMTTIYAHFLFFSTSGVQFESTPIRVQIPSKSIHEIVLVGRALHPGNLVIRGCFVQTHGSTRQEYVLPLFTNEQRERVAKKRARLLCELDRFKHSGLDSFPWMDDYRPHDQLEIAKEPNPAKDFFTFLECTVVPQQPLLRIRRTSINHGALMLYDGERQVIDAILPFFVVNDFLIDRSSVCITLENISPLPIDFLRVVFEDSTIALAQQLLSEGNLSVFDAYETEHDLINRPLFSWDTEQGQVILPGENISLSLTCHGKGGW